MDPRHDEDEWPKTWWMLSIVSMLFGTVVGIVVTLIFVALLMHAC